MKKFILTLAMLLLVYVFTSFTGKPLESIKTDSSINTNLPIGVESDASTILKKSLDYLGNLKSFSVKVQSSLEDITTSGHRIDLVVASSLTVNRPNKLHVERHGSLLNQLFYFNGKEISLYNPVQKVYATESIEGTIEEMFQSARENFGLEAPAADLMYANSFSLLMYEVNFTEVIGIEYINNVECYHLLFSRPGVDFQIWIAENGNPLPYKYVVTDTTTPELLSVSLTFSDWKENPTISDKLFSFSPPKDAQKISFIKASEQKEIE